MQKIANYIKENNKKFSIHPLIHFLEDSSVSPEKKLSIAPCMAFFAMSFGDLNRYVYRDEDSSDTFQKIVNEHTFEDENHFLWFIKDCVRLGWNQDLTLTAAMLFLWGKETIGVRRAVYDFSALLRYATSFERYVVMESIEGHGNVLFTATCRVAEELSRSTGKDYIFFGPHHLAAETGHAVGDTVTRLQADVDCYQPTQDQHDRAIYLVDEVYTIFTRYNDDLYNYAMLHSSGESLMAKLHQYQAA